MKTQESVILVGDSNMRGLKVPLLDRLNRDRGAQGTALPGAKIRDIMEAAENRRSQTPEHTLRDIQGGLNRVLNGEDPSEAARSMMERVERWHKQSPTSRFCICSVPFSKQEVWRWEPTWLP